MELSSDWVVGFVDGEGCFHVGINRHPDLATGYQVLPEFVVVQHELDVQILFALKRFFRGGVVRQNHGDRWWLRIRNLKMLLEVCRFFSSHPLKTRKNVEFHKFRRVIQFLDEGRHLQVEGLLSIVDIALSMNTADRPALLVIKEALLGQRDSPPQIGNDLESR